MGTSSGTGGFDSTIIAAIALIIGSVLTQFLNYMYMKRHAILAKLRSEFAIRRTDVILDWGREIETALFEIDDESIMKKIESAKNMYGKVARAAHRQDIVLDSNWKSQISQIHATIGSIIESQNGMTAESKITLASCNPAVTNLLIEVEWWRLFLLRYPVPGKIHVKLQKIIHWKYFGPRKQSEGDL